MSAIRAIIIALLAASPAWAQQPAPPPPDQTVQDIVADWSAESRARDHTATSLQKFIAAYQKAEAERAKLATEIEGWKAYARPLYEQQQGEAK